MAISVTKSTNAVSATERVVAFSTASAGDLLIAIIFGDGTGTFTWAGTTTATELLDIAIGTVARVAVAYRIATGGETTIDADCSASERSCNLGIRIPAAEWHGTTPPEIANAASASTANPNPPSLNPAGWDVENTLWIAGYGADSGVVSAYPTTFTDNRTASDTTTSAAYGAIATLASSVASIDPGTFTNSTTDDAVAFTIAVRPAASTPVTGSGGLSLPAPAIAGTAAETFTGTAALTLPAPAISGTGAEAFTGTGGLTLLMSMAGTGEEGFTGTGGLTLLQSQAGEGTVINPVDGSGGVTLGLSISGTGEEGFTGTGAVTLGMSMAGTGEEGFTGSAALSIPAPSISGSGEHTEQQGATGSGGVTIPAPSIAGTGEEGFTGSGGVTLALSVSGTGAEGFEGSGGVTFGLSIAGEGEQTQPVTGSGGVIIPAPAIEGSEAAIEFHGGPDDLGDGGSERGTAMNPANQPGGASSTAKRAEARRQQAEQEALQRTIQDAEAVLALL